VPKGAVDAGHPVVYSDGNGLTITGCDMTGFTRNHVRLGKAVEEYDRDEQPVPRRAEAGERRDGKVVTGHNIDE
jgi:hypothetical protein